jgi:hypothetical protein
MLEFQVHRKKDVKWRTVWKPQYMLEPRRIDKMCQFSLPLSDLGWCPAREAGVFVTQQVKDSELAQRSQKLKQLFKRSGAITGPVTAPHQDGPPAGKQQCVGATRWLLFHFRPPKPTVAISFRVSSNWKYTEQGILGNVVQPS